MLKQSITYTDFNEEQQSETLYFNLTQTELMDLLDLQPRLEAWARNTAGQNRDLTTAEIRELLEIVKELIERSYGVRSEDGKRFSKTPAVWEEFRDSAAYDAFLFSLFETPDRALEFMRGILPKSVVDKMETTTPVETIKTGGELSAVDEDVPAWIREDRAPTDAELRGATPEQMRLAFARKNAARS